MSVRVLTIEEMEALPVGANAVLSKDVEECGLPIGTPVQKRFSNLNDNISVAFEYGEDNQWEYFEEGEIGVVEIDPQPLIVKEQTQRPAEELGMFRPELETRKVGKIRVELVDDGFPLALREVAKVMTWAQTAKGYKDHDWQNLPDAEIALAAAASRHRSDYIEQRVIQGLPSVECVDPESALVHKAHEAFGILAQLELLLRGKFVDSRVQIGV